MAGTELRHKLVAAVLGVAAAIHVLPSVGVIGEGTLSRLYGADVADPNVVLLLRHRAVLFGLLGVGLAVAALRRAWHAVALAVALVSTATFIALAWATPGRTAQIDRVVLVDVVVVVLLAIAMVIRVRSQAGE